MAPSTPYGRDDLLRRVLEELGAPGALVTLTGLAGSGSSTVARVAVQRAAAAGPDVEQDAGRPGPARTCTVEGRACRADGALQAALEGCASSDVDLILVEDVHHAADGPSAVEDQRRSRPGLRVLLTARTPVGLPDEVVVRVPPLGLPDPLDEPGRLRTEPAVRLFLDRAARAGAPVDIDGHALADVARICRHLGGLPLAVGLVAARAATYSPSTLLHLLHRTPGQLLRPPGGARAPDDLADHDLATALGWSVSLLHGSARDLLLDLAVLGSPVTVEDVERVSGRDDVVDDLAALVDVHLVEADHAGPVTLFVVAPVVRDHLRALAPPTEELTGRHRAWARQVARSCLDLEDAGRPTRARLRAATVEPDLTDALASAAADGDAPAATDLTLALLPVWFARGAVRGTVERVAEVLTLGGPVTNGPVDSGPVDSTYLVRQLVLATWLQLLRAETANAAADVAAVVPELARLREAALGLGDRAVLHVDFVAVQTARSMVEREVAEEWAREGRALARRLGDEARLVRFETWLGMLAHQRGEPEEAAAWAQQAAPARTASTSPRWPSPRPGCCSASPVPRRPAPGCPTGAGSSTWPASMGTCAPSTGSSRWQPSAPWGPGTCPRRSGTAWRRCGGPGPAGPGPARARP
ncbi:hypothetical protein BJF81_06175 [Ornithinimicrobium sp. CNJ-824]|uniref:hypothetical protein n=1 Tax=Ornithinimicrobium sp. CNJ-824 TaxID=1904966 RepID=UPI00095DB84D|nr:hypothetical protein [Ornithinimicrobium sp. CNJ-824]OLT19985.1 hypothetical protein BJF81_06175 [Ornithinimicrobium sp. CNJ-824]